MQSVLNHPKRFIATSTFVSFMVLLASCASKPADIAAQPPPTPQAAQPNAQMQKVLDAYKSLDPKPLPTLTAKEARKQPSAADAAKKVMKEENIKPDMAGFLKVQNKHIQEGKTSTNVRIYTPKGKGTFPAVVYYHGGGFVIADLDVYDATPRILGKGLNAVVVSVEYRKGPENKFPAAHEDAFNAYLWVVKHQKDLKIAPGKIALAGESAGGNLTVNVAMKARDEKVQMPVAELVVYPMAGTDLNTPSYLANAGAKFLDKPMMEWFYKNYTSTEQDMSDPRLNLVAANLTGLPATTIITDQIDPLMSEGKTLADKMKEQGVNVTYKNYDGVTHEFFGMGQVIDQAKQAEDFAVEQLNAALK